jgi:hypothetical protein
LRYIYKIIYDEFCGTKTNTKISFQITIKTINNSVGPNSIIFIFFIFRTYPGIINNSALSLITIKKTETIRKTTKKIKYFYAKR